MKLTKKLDSDYKRLDKISELQFKGSGYTKGFVSVMSKKHADTLNIFSNYCCIKIYNYSKQENNSIIKEQNTDFNFGSKGVPELDNLFDNKNYVASRVITKEQIKTILELETCSLAYKENGMTKLAEFKTKLFTATLKLLDRVMLDNKLDSLEFNFMPNKGRHNLKPVLINVSPDMKIILAPTIYIRNYLK